MSKGQFYTSPDDEWRYKLSARFDQGASSAIKPRNEIRVGYVTSGDPDAARRSRELLAGFGS